MKPKEFFKRWGQGIREVTPLQMAFFNLWSYILVIIGVLFGLYVSFISKVWWLFLILIGSMFLTLTSFLSTYQRYYILKKINKQIGGLDE